MQADDAVVKALAVEHQLTTPSMYEAGDRRKLMAFASALLREHAPWRLGSAASAEVEQKTKSGR